MNSNEKLYLSEFSRHIKPFGFKKSGKIFWKNEGDIKVLINFQKSQWGASFYINIGFYFESLSSLDKKVPKDYDWHFCSRIDSLIEMQKTSLDKLSYFDIPDAKIVVYVEELFDYFKKDIIPLIENIGNYSYLKSNFYETGKFEGFIIQNIKSSDLLKFIQSKST